MDAAQREARSGSDVWLAVAVDVERFAETETELTARDFGNDAPRDAPSLTRFRTGSGALRRLRRYDDGGREKAAGEQADASE